MARQPDLPLRASERGRRAIGDETRKEVNERWPATRSTRERAVLDSAHVGDIQGAFGTIGQHDTGRAAQLARARRSRCSRSSAPGLIVMVGDNDAGGVATYSQAGQNYGTSLLWVLLLLIPVLIVNQEMVVRLGAVTGVGHARLINERFGRFWGWFSVGDLFLLNFLTIVTEFIGVDLALALLRRLALHLGADRRGAARRDHRHAAASARWERMMFVFVFANLLVIPLFFLSHPQHRPTSHTTSSCRGSRAARTRPRSC